MNALACCVSRQLKELIYGDLPSGIADLVAKVHAAMVTMTVSHGVLLHVGVYKVDALFEHPML